jgi:hypothetical protein
VISSPISVSLRVTTPTFSVSGTVLACTGPSPACPPPQSQPLPGATVTLVNGAVTVATTTADTAGNFSFSGIAAGTYSITASGSDASNTHYTGSATLPVTGNTTGFTLQVFPG